MHRIWGIENQRQSSRAGRLLHTPESECLQAPTHNLDRTRGAKDHRPDVRMDGGLWLCK